MFEAFILVLVFIGCRSSGSSPRGAVFLLGVERFPGLVRLDKACSICGENYVFSASFAAEPSQPKGREFFLFDPFLDSDFRAAGHFGELLGGKISRVHIL